MAIRECQPISLPYHVTRDAPKGGRIVLAKPGRTIRLNPHIEKGRAPWASRVMFSNRLWAQLDDEPFTLYGLLAETVETIRNALGSNSPCAPKHAFPTAARSPSRM